MIYVFNKNKILSYIIACSFVLMLFTFKDDIRQNEDVQIVKVSTNAINSINNINDVDNINETDNN